MVNRVVKGAAGGRGGQFAPDLSGRDKVPTANVAPSVKYDGKSVPSVDVSEVFKKFSNSKVSELEAVIREREERIGQWKIFVKSAELKGRNLKTVEKVIQHIKFEEDLLNNDRAKLNKLLVKF